MFLAEGMESPDVLFFAGGEVLLLAASTRCFPDVSLQKSMEQLAELEYTNIELQLHESGPFRPSEVAAEPARALIACRPPQRLTVIACSVDLEIPPDEEYYRRFQACCRLSRSLVAGVVTVRASVLGTPFNEEIERLRRLVSLTAPLGLALGLLTETGRMTERTDTALALCEHVPGLMLTLDPSYFLYGPRSGTSYDPLLPYVCHVRLRDTSKDRFQVRIGQGIVEYGRLIQMLEKHQYRRALCADFAPMTDIDQNAELRKMRLLLESQLKS